MVGGKVCGGVCVCGGGAGGVEAVGRPRAPGWRSNFRAGGPGRFRAHWRTHRRRPPLRRRARAPAPPRNVTSESVRVRPSPSEFPVAAPRRTLGRPIAGRRGRRPAELGCGGRRAAGLQRALQAGQPPGPDGTAARRPAGRRRDGGPPLRPAPVRKRDPNNLPAFRREERRDVITSAASPSGRGRRCVRHAGDPPCWRRAQWLESHNPPMLTSRARVESGSNRRGIDR